MGKMIMNGVSYGINANSTIYGAFIDTTNILKPRTAYAGSFSYTATQDCAVVVEVANATSNSASIFIDGALVGSIYGGNSVNQLTDTYYIKRGQTISGTTGVSGAEVGYAVYGLLYNAGETTNTVIPNPQAVPRDTLDSISIGGMVYDVGSKYGAFIDTNRVIQAQTPVSGNSSVTYTATEDCFLIAMLARSSTADSYVAVNGVTVLRNRSDGNVFSNICGHVYLKRGDVATIKSGSADTSTNYTIYGLTFGTNNIFTPQIYSLEERKIGTWIDNKPLYQKTIEISQYNVTLKNDVWTNICAISDADYMVKTVINTQSPNTAYLMRFQIDNGYLQGAANVQVTLTQYRQLYVTLYYTKSSDVAGSSSYNTLGVPMVHYSTDEQVIGTYLGKPLYQRVITPIVTASTTLAGDIKYGSVVLGDYINSVDMAFVDLSASYIEPATGATRGLISASYEKDSGNIVIVTMFTRTNSPSSLCIKYTKITD